MASGKMTPFFIADLPKILLFYSRICIPNNKVLNKSAKKGEGGIFQSKSLSSHFCLLWTLFLTCNCSCCGRNACASRGIYWASGDWSGNVGDLPMSAYKAACLAHPPRRPDLLHLRPRCRDHVNSGLQHHSKVQTGRQMSPCRCRRIEWGRNLGHCL